MSSQVSPSPGHDRDDGARSTSPPLPHGTSGLWVRVIHDVPTVGIPSVIRVSHRLACNKDGGWNLISTTSDAPIPWTESLETVVTGIMQTVLADLPALVHLEIVLPGKLLECVLRELGDVDVPLLERLTVQDCCVDDTEGYHRLPSYLFRDGAPRLSEVVLTNVNWLDGALHACTAVTSVSLVSDFPLTDDLRSLIYDCRQLRALTISAPFSAAVLRGLPVLQNLKRLTATLDLGSLSALQDVLPASLEHFNIAEHGRAAPSEALLLLMISLWIVNRKTISVYLARNLFAVRCEGTGVRVLQTAKGADFLSVTWLRGALPRNVTSLDISLIDWSIIANALKDFELSVLKQLTVRFAREPPLIPEDLPVHSQLTLRCPNLRMLVLQDFSLYWTLPLSNVSAFLRDCLLCEPSNVRICPRGATIISDTESRDFKSLTTPQTLSEVVANGGGVPLDEFAFWEDPDRVLTHFAPQAYRYYRMGPHALTTDRGDD